jgi:hypothetical protein
MEQVLKESTMPTIKTSSFQLTPNTDQPAQTACPNINTAERLKRLRIGIVVFAVALVLLAVLVANGSPRLWRLPLGLFFIGAAFCYFEWKDKTCVALVKAGVQFTGDRMERVKDAAAMAQMKIQANRVLIKSILAGSAITLLALLLPVMG